MSKINLRYSISEGFKNFFLNGFMTFAAVGIIAACFLVTGSFTLLAFNIDATVEKVQKQSEITIYIDDSLSDEQAKDLKQEIDKIPYINQSVFVTRAQALENYRETLGENADILDGLDNDNPLPNSYRITLTDLRNNEQVASALAQIPGVDEVVNNSNTSRKLISFRSMINAVCIALVAMLGAVSIFIISNTVKLATFARREEIAIMKMVGATNRFVRFPFVIEGLLLGEVGAIIAFFLQWGFYAYIEETASIDIGIIEVIPFSVVFPPLAITLLIAGIIIGAGGSVLAVRKFLKV